MSQKPSKDEMDVDLTALQHEVDEEFDLNDNNIFGNSQDSELNEEMALLEKYVTSDISKYPISKKPPKYKLIEPSILFEFWGHNVLDSYKKQTNKVISLFKRKELKVPNELEEQLSFLTNKILMLETSIQNGQMSEEQYKRSLINALNRELLELPCRALEDFNEFEQNITCILNELLTFFDNESDFSNEANSVNESEEHEIKNEVDIINLLQIPSEFFLTNEEKTLFWGSFVLTFYLRLADLIVKIFNTIDPSYPLPTEFLENKSYCANELKKIKDDTKSGKVNPSDYLDLISQAVQREKAKKGSLLPPQKHRINILEKELDQVNQYLDDDE